MIRIHDLSLKAGEFLLQNVELTVPEGSCHVLVGPTGAGKTLLLETLVGFRTPLSGSLLMDGADILPSPPAARKIAYLPQDVCLFPHMTVQDNVHYGLRARGIKNVTWGSAPDPAQGTSSLVPSHRSGIVITKASASDAQVLTKNPDVSVGPGPSRSWRGLGQSPIMINEHLDHLIDFFAIRELLTRYPHGLSGGEKQRVALVRALAVQPRLVVMDEPFSAIDATMREETRRLFRSMQREFGLTTLLVTHDFEEACFLGDQISILIGGRIRQSGDRHSVWNYPKKMDVAKFLGIRNVFAAQVREAVPGRTTVVWPDKSGTLAIACGCGHLRYKPGDPVHWGIRPEAVEVPENGEADRDNRYQGTIQAAYVRGRHHTLDVSLANDLQIEMDLPARDLRRSGGEPGQNLEFRLPPESIFILED